MDLGYHSLLGLLILAGDIWAINRGGLGDQTIPAIDQLHLQRVCAALDLVEAEHERMAV